MKVATYKVGEFYRKEILRQIRGTIMKTVGQLGIRIPSRKLKKEVKSASRDIAELVINSIMSYDRSHSLTSKFSNEK